MHSSRERRGGAPAPVLVALFLVSATLTTLFLRRALPRGGADELVDVKLALFEQRRDDYSVLFLGSSRTHRGFVPSVFDARMRELGWPTHSFNFGAPGARAFEMRLLLERIAALAPSSLDFVLVDPEGLSLLRDERNPLARQVIEWHDPPATLAIARTLLALDLELRPKLALLSPHLKSCAYNLTNIGRAELWVDAALGKRRTAELMKQLAGPELDGYAPLGQEGEELGRRGQRFQKKHREAYLAELAAFRELASDDAPPSEFALEMYAELERRVRALEATLVFVAQPALYHQDDLIRAHELGQVGPLLRYDDPEANAELYEPEHRYDATHLNDEGARLFTERLASDFARALSSGEIKRR